MSPSGRESFTGYVDLVTARPTSYREARRRGRGSGESGDEVASRRTSCSRQRPRPMTSHDQYLEARRSPTPSSRPVSHGIRSGLVAPVLIGSVSKDVGVGADRTRSCTICLAAELGEIVARTPRQEAKLLPMPTSARRRVFKTTADPFVGR